MVHAFIPGNPHTAVSHEDLQLPDYASMLAAYHRAYAPELQGIIDGLPLRSGDRVLDMACGDGTYAPWLASHVGKRGRVVGADISFDYLRLARQHVDENGVAQRIHLTVGDVEHLPFADDSFDLVWCAQSLYDFLDPLRALQEMRRVAQRGGRVAVLENDRLHHLLLPWPAALELQLRQAELRALRRETRRPQRFYVGRRLLHLFRRAGLRQCRKRTYASNRRAPLDQNAQAFLLGYLQRLQQRVHDDLDPALRDRLEAYIDPRSACSLLHHPDLTVTCVDHVIWGVKP